MLTTAMKIAYMMLSELTSTIMPSSAAMPHMFRKAHASKQDPPRIQFLFLPVYQF
jgi:hypothetical protein